MKRLAWLGAGLAAGVAFALPRVLKLEGELEARDDADRDSAREADKPSPLDEDAPAPAPLPMTDEELDAAIRSTWQEPPLDGAELRAHRERVFASIRRDAGFP